MVGIDMESAIFNEVPESLDRLVDSKKISVESTVLRFGVVEFLREEINGLPASIDVLLQEGHHHRCLKHP